MTPEEVHILIWLHSKSPLHQHVRGIRLRGAKRYRALSERPVDVRAPARVR
jgi:hypothetical protein